jgi:hypothetical protein
MPQELICWLSSCREGDRGRGLFKEKTPKWEEGRREDGGLRDRESHQERPTAYVIGSSFIYSFICELSQPSSQPLTEG